MAVRNNRGRDRSELNSSHENQEDLAAIDNETDWAFPFYSTDTSHSVWWLRLRTRSILTELRLPRITCIVRLWVNENETGRKKDCVHIWMVNTTLSSHWFFSLSKWNHRTIEWLGLKGIVKVILLKWVLCTCTASWKSASVMSRVVVSQCTVLPSHKVHTGGSSSSPLSRWLM